MQFASVSQTQLVSLIMRFTFKVKARTPSSGLSSDDQIHRIHQNSQDKESKGNLISFYTFCHSACHIIITWFDCVCVNNADLCGFCRKPVTPSEPAIEALNRTYHDGCFQCRSCHIPLAGKQYYNKAGIPLCEDCYQVAQCSVLTKLWIYMQTLTSWNLSSSLGLIFLFLLAFWD